METAGSVWLNKADKDAVVVEEHAVNVNPDPIPFRTWDDFLHAPDPHEVKPRRIGWWQQIRGETPWIMVSSYGICFTQQRIHSPRSFTSLFNLYGKAKTDGRNVNGVAKASEADAQAVPTIATLALAAVAVIATIVVAIVVLSSKFGG